MNKLVSNSRTRVLMTCRTWFAQPQRGVLTAAPNSPKSRLASLNPAPPQRTESRRHRSGGTGMNVFDREMKRRQRKWAASLQGSQQFDYLRDEVMTSISPQVQWISWHETNISPWPYINTICIQRNNDCNNEYQKHNNNSKIITQMN